LFEMGCYRCVDVSGFAIQNHTLVASTVEPKDGELPGEPFLE
jgi:hypothetical protein